jgi:hypothetical protein
LKKDVKKTEPEKVKDLEEIMRKVEEKSRVQIEKVNEEVEKLTEDRTNLAKQLQEALDNNKEQQAALIRGELDKVNQSLGKVLIDKKKIINKKNIEDLIRFQNTP